MGNTKKPTSSPTVGGGFLEQIIAPEGVVKPEWLAARQSFWAYCKLIDPKFFRDDRLYQRELANTLQGIFLGTHINPATGEPYRKLMINMPPRHGKSYIITLFVQWCMGRHNETRCITVSYNDTLAARFARGVRDGIDASKIDDRFSIFADVFPGTHVKYGDASAQLWSLEGQYFNYLGAGFGGTLTGVGCSIGIIDDPIKNNEEAFNDRVLDEQWAWYGDTFLSRIEEGGIQVVIMTRWSTKDLCGRLLESEDGHEWLVFSRPACLDDETGIMLCPSLLSYKSYKRKRRLTSPEIADANYQQQPVDIKGRLYGDLQTYDALPREEDGRMRFEQIIAYTDTADEGADFLCSIVAGVYKGEGWVLDILYTDQPMEKTEPDTAEQYHRFVVNTAYIESNNGGRGFARNVERLLWDNHSSRYTAIEWLHQGANKQARIMAGSSYIMRHLYFPADWMRRWPAYYAAMISYQRTGRNKHDDAPDATTGIVEKIQEFTGGDTYDLWWLGEEDDDGLAV